MILNATETALAKISTKQTQKRYTDVVAQQYRFSRWQAGYVHIFKKVAMEWMYVLGISNDVNTSSNHNGGTWGGTW